MLYPQLRFSIKGTPLSQIVESRLIRCKGTQAAYIKHGIDVQEEQLKKHAVKALEKDSYGIEPESDAGLLYSGKHPSGERCALRTCF